MSRQQNASPVRQRILGNIQAPSRAQAGKHSRGQAWTPLTIGRLMNFAGFSSRPGMWEANTLATRASACERRDLREI